MVKMLPTDFPGLTLKDTERQKKILELVSPLILTETQQVKMREVFLDEMRLGLAASPEKKSSLLMENTFIPELPKGTENGEYLSLDLGGTNFRVIYVLLEKGKAKKEMVDFYHVPQEKRLGPVTSSLTSWPSVSLTLYTKGTSRVDTLNSGLPSPSR
ncbi:hypothetical protein Pcinc_035101 [Petrolisthes cinctipes]|uniref:Phosphotransferase n=1 Tax=Petrolisthes cinctipes TaxID=88211 RepID=A0AAE1BXI0_PETCI|nr:hypothetical protein Pcinc_035101 [Petrolisthes cinctipes]